MFYEMSSTLKKNALHLNPVNYDDIKDKRAVMKGDLIINEPQKFTKYSGSWDCCLASTGYATIILISEHFKEKLIANKISGWGTFPVEIIDEDFDRQKKFFGLVVKGRCGAIDEKLTPWIEDEDGDKFKMGLLFEPSSWDGSDIFTPDNRDQLFTFVTERVKDIFDECKCAEFTDITKIKRIWEINK